MTSEAEPLFVIEVPSLGEAFEVLDVERWLVAEGAQVARDQAVVVLSTDVVSVEVPAPVAGRVLLKHAPDGQQVRVGAPLLSLLLDEGEVPPGDR